ncbi:MAG: GGDEF domain-containing protein [Nitrospirae bacterium]|nr:GGDEF domain-containing protein [Nitrospirota bacterium]
MYKILIIDKGKSSLHNVKTSLLKKYEVFEARGLPDANLCLKNTPIDLLLTDDTVYPALVNSDRFRKYAAGIPRIILVSPSGVNGKGLWVNEVHTVPLREPVSRRELIRWIKRLLDIKALENENRALREDLQLKQKKIEEISITDDLTELYNFRFMNQCLDTEIERARRYGTFFSLVFMDIDNLKKINEKYGHLAGTKVLIGTAEVLRQNLRKVDMIFRYGGDEFVIILPQTPKEGGVFVAERLRRMMEKNVFLKEEGMRVRITASFGVAPFPGSAKGREELLSIADHAMFHGKFSTKNVVFAHE